MIERLLRVALVGSEWVLYFLIALSMISFTAMLERWLYFRRHRDDMGKLRARVRETLSAGDLDATDAVLKKSRSVEAHVLRDAIRWSDGGPSAVADAVESELSNARGELERGLNLLGTLGNNAPFVGLFGTVLGVIQAFHQLADTGNKDAMGNVMGGIAEALVATGVGLFVALPAVVAYNVVQKKIGEIETNVSGLSRLVTAYLQLADRQGRAPRVAERLKEDEASLPALFAAEADLAIAGSGRANGVAAAREASAEASE